MDADLILKNAVVVTMDAKRRILDNGTVVVADGKIIDVDEKENVKWQAKKVIDCGGDLLIPGFVDCMGDAGRTVDHMGADWPLTGWENAVYNAAQMEEVWWEEEGAREANLALFFGITSVHRAMPAFIKAGCVDAFQKGARKKGLRMIVSCGPDLQVDRDKFEEQMKETVKILEHSDRRLYIKRPSCAASALFPQRILPGSVPPDFERCRERIKYLLRSVLPQTPLTAQMSGGELTIYLQAVPELAEREMILFGMHGADLGEIGQMQKNSFTYVHIPQTHLRTPLFLKMLAAGIPCAIAPGTANRRIPRDMLLAGRRAMLEEITALDDYHYLPAGKVLELMTVEAAKVLGEDEVSGSIEVGKQANLSVLGWHTAHMTPNFMPVQAMILRGYGQDIHTVVANGRVVKRNGHLTEGKEGEDA